MRPYLGLWKGRQPPLEFAPRLLTWASDLHFLDLTPDIAATESAGRRLYWNYDSHMNRNGYRLCAEHIAEWWLHWRERHLEQYDLNDSSSQQLNHIQR